MLDRVMHVLEFDKIRAQLMQHAACSLGKDKAERLYPSIQFEEVVRWQEETDEATKVLRLKGSVPLGGIFDIRASLKRAKIGGILNPEELLDISSTIYGSRNIKRFIQDLVEDEIEVPILENYSKQLEPQRGLEQEIKSCIDDHGHVMDGASDQLRSIRSTLRTTESRIREKLEGMTRSSSSQKKLSDAIITIRNYRYVLPVKQEYSGSFGGIVHDQSASGATLFIEPQVVVALNNQLREARLKEKQEIDRILKNLSTQTAEVADIILHDVSILAEIDFMFTKASFGQRIRASKPKINNYGYVNIKKGRHPLISGEEVVANDIELGKEYSSIVITGPNTGGKTVALKTIGLFTLMAQAGLQIPALDGSEMAVFKAVFADIGDEQSIEQSLSTFSSHMTNIVKILEQVDHESLVLFDELGAGTDPQEGAALAISILDFVYQRGARVIATTHYPELKAYGYNRDGVINASVEFDVETLSPTYRLLIGVPGRSNAFEISKRLGLNMDIIDKARQQISTETNNVENMIASLEETQKKAERDWDEAQDTLKDAEQLREELQKQIIALNEEKERILEKANEKAKKAVEKARAEAEEVINELRTLQKEKHAEIKDHKLIEARKRLEDAELGLGTKKESTKKSVDTKKEFMPGDEVKVLTFDQKGHIVQQIDKNQYEVQIGIMKMKVKRKDLEFIKSEEPVKTRPMATVKGTGHSVKTELDLRGERFEDALIQVEKYIDDALLAGYPSVSIIHGKGTGALRKGVQDYLSAHRSVKNMRLGGMNEGGSGVTVVEFK